MNPISAPRGTRDVYPPESARWNRLEADCRDLAQRFGYGEIRTPIFEATELFRRGVGETTDIVEKEMYTFLDKAGRSMTLRPELTAGVVRALLDHFRPHAAELSADSQRRLERNPLRILDSKDEKDLPFVASAPTILDVLCDDCRAHFEGVKRYLDVLGIKYQINPRLVRGLDYYTRTVFEFVSSALGAQSTVCGGGRYDGLVAELGGPPTPGVGFGLGLERFLMVVEKLAGERAPERRGVQAIALGDAAREPLHAIVGALREAWPEPVFADWQGRKLTAHFKTADRNGARWAVILGDDELAQAAIVLRDLAGRTDRRLALAGSPAEVAAMLVEATA